MSTAPHQQPVSVQDYLAGEKLARRKHEFVAGTIYAMAGATANHNRIATTATVTIGSQLRGKTCEVFNSDMKVRVRQKHDTRFYYPDLSVVCDPNAQTETFHDRPVVIVEVISESTRRTDEHEKRDAYLSIDSLCVYVLLESSSAAAVVYRRRDEGFDRETYLGIDAVIDIPKRRHQKIRDVDERIKLSGYEGQIRQVAVTGLSRKHPTLFLTNNVKITVRDLVTNDARRNGIEDALGTSVNFFHLDCLSSEVRLNVDPDTVLTVLAPACRQTGTAAIASITNSIVSRSCSF